MKVKLLTYGTISGMMRQIYKIFALLLISHGATVFAADASTDTDVIKYQETIHEEIELRVNKFLSRYLQSNQFAIDINVEAKSEKMLSLPYVPSNSGSYLKSSPIKNVLSLISALEIKLFISSEIKKKHSDSIKKLLSNRYSTNEMTPSISIKKLTLQGKSSENAADRETLRELDKVQQDLRQAQSDMKKLERERNDIKNELIQSKTNKPDKTNAKEKSSNDANLYYLIGIISAVLFLIAFLTSKTISSAIRTVGQGMADVASSLGAVGINNQSSDDDDDEKSSNDPATADAPLAAQAVAANGESKEDLRSLSEDLSQAINENNLPIVLKFLKERLSQPGSVAAGVALLELLHRDKSTVIFAKLNEDLQIAVSIFLETGSYGEPKQTLMINTGEDLKTKLMGSQFAKPRGKINIALSELILQLSTSDLLHLSAELNQQQLARITLYISPKILADVLNSAKKMNNDTFKALLDALKLSHKFAQEVNLDQEISVKIQKYVNDGKGELIQNHLHYYTEVIDSLTDGLADEALDIFRDADERVANYLSSKIITFKTFFKLVDYLREQIVQSITNKGLAALLAGLNDEEKDQMYKEIPDRRQGLIEEETDALLLLPKKKQTKLHEDQKRKIISSIRKLQESDDIEYENEESPATGDIQGAA